MTHVDKDVSRRLLNEAAEALQEVKYIIEMNVDDFSINRHIRYSLRYSIMLIVEALADLAVAILEKDFNQTVESYREAFMKLGDNGVVDSDIAYRMAKLASLRNLLVHRYWSIDDRRIYKEAKESGVEAVEKFLNKVKGYVEAEGY